VNEAFYRQTSRIEDRHWWFRARRTMADRVLRADGFTKGGRGLDLGCGSGGNLALLQRHCDEVVALDRSPLALELARTKHGRAQLICGDANRLDRLFVPHSFQLVTIFNVLYHRWIHDEAALLSGVGRALRPGGRLLLTEPAFPLLFRRHDRVDWGRRRYRLGEMLERVREAGFAVRRASYFNLPAFLPALLLAAAERSSRTFAAEENVDVRELSIPAAPINRALEALMGLEGRWIGRGGRLPLGVGLLVLAQVEPRPAPAGDPVRS